MPKSTIVKRSSAVALVATVVAMGSAGAAGAQGAPAATAPTASAQATSEGDGCPLLHVVIAQGTTESTSSSSPKDDSGTLATVVLPVLSEFGGITETNTFDRTYVPYPADFGFQGTPYEQSYRQGVQNTLGVIAKIAETCPNTKLGIMGYSQGGNVASTVLRLIGAGQGPVSPSQVAMGMLFSDPTRTAGDATFPGRPTSQTSPDSVPGVRGSEVAKLETPVVAAAAAGGGIAPLSESTPQTFGSLTGRVASACAAGDLSCDTPVDAPLARLVTNVAGQLDLDQKDPVGILTSAASVLGTTTLNMVSDVVTNDIVTTDGTTRGLDYRPGASLSERAQAAANPEHQSDPVEALTKLVGIGINTGIAFAKDVLTMENIAQIATVGLVDPAAGLAVLASKAANAALNLIPTNIANKSAKAVETVVRNEFTDNAGLVKMATDVRYWSVRANHESYQRDPVTSTGETWLQFATSWIKAVVRDLESGSASGQGGVGAFTRTVPVSGQGSYQGLPGLVWSPTENRADVQSFDLAADRNVSLAYASGDAAWEWTPSVPASSAEGNDSWSFSTSTSTPTTPANDPWAGLSGASVGAN